MSEGPPYLKTCHRYNIPGDSHELTFSCYKNQPLLLHERTRFNLMVAIDHARHKHSFDLWAWVFMPDHVHLLIKPGTDSYNISKILQTIKQSVSRKEINYARKNNPESLTLLLTGQKDRPFRFWQDGGGYDRNFHSRKLISASIDYIHNNPVKAGIAKNAEDWVWSSAIEWLGLGVSPLSIDKRSIPIL